MRRYYFSRTIPCSGSGARGSKSSSSPRIGRATCRRSVPSAAGSWTSSADCLNYLENLSTHHLQKQHDRSQVRGWVSYPLPALRETLVNAVYHRGYDVDQPEPTKVYLYPSRVEVISYPGPLPGIEPQHLAPDAQVPPVPARNRRIGEFLKELKLAEGRLSGLPKVFQAMEANGSPAPHFDFDEQRTYFRATHCRLIRNTGRSPPCGMPRTSRRWGSRRKRSSGWSPRGRPTRRQRCSRRK